MFCFGNGDNSLFLIDLKPPMSTYKNLDLFRRFLLFLAFLTPHKRPINENEVDFFHTLLEKILFISEIVRKSDTSM